MVAAWHRDLSTTARRPKHEASANQASPGWRRSNDAITTQGRREGDGRAECLTGSSTSSAPCRRLPLWDRRRMAPSRRAPAPRRSARHSNPANNARPQRRRHGHPRPRRPPPKRKKRRAGSNRCGVSGAVCAQGATRVVPSRPTAQSPRSRQHID